ncbi:MAG: hypothetical protein V1903_11315 [Bacteroidota bacterium]
MIRIPGLILIWVIHMVLREYEKAIPEYEKALELFDSWDMKPWPPNYAQLGYSYHQTAQYKKEIKLYRKAEKDFPDHYLLLMRQAVLALTMGESNKAKRYIEKYVSVRKDKNVSEADMASELAEMYSGAGISNKAEEYYRQAFLLDPENPVRMNNLAFFIIDKERNIAEGLELIEKALTLSPDNYLYLDTRGWGLYKQGKLMEALELLEKSWELKHLYDHGLYLHLEAAKKAVAGEK